MQLLFSNLKTNIQNATYNHGRQRKHNSHSLILSTQSQRVQRLRQTKIKSINHTPSHLQIYVNKNSECQSVCHHVVSESEIVSEHWGYFVQARQQIMAPLITLAYGST